LVILKTAILVGGAGTRLYPLTNYIPKALIPLGGKTVIDHILDYLTRFGMREIVVLSSSDDYPALSNHLGNGSGRGMKITYNVQDRLGTGGALGAASSSLTETFVVYYGDILIDFDLLSEIQFHRDHHAALTITFSNSVPIDYGVARLSTDGRVTFFKEKPVLPEYPICTGVFVAEPTILPYCLPGTDLAADVIPRLLQDNLPVYGFTIEKRHYDIGTFNVLEEVRSILRHDKPSEMNGNS
jgi:NDP-sugar pyrophosphorylase family protein